MSAEAITGTEIEEVAYHRNGVSGEGFFVVNFIDPENRSMMGVVFVPDGARDDGGHMRAAADIPFHNPRIAVFHRELLPEIGFTRNSWRGDNYQRVLYDAIREHEHELWR